MIQEALARLLEGRDLTRADARAVMAEVMAGGATQAQIAGFLVALLQAGAGIVADSIEEEEYQECLRKLAAVEAAIEAAEAAQ